MTLRIPRRQYADLYGPTVGDRVRLADTELLIEIEHDLTTLRRGGEVRRRQGDPRRHGPVGAGHARGGALDLVITNALIIDHWGIVKADIGIRDGRIVGGRQGRQSRHHGRRHRRHGDRRRAPR